MGMLYHMSMQGIVVTGQIVAGFALLARIEARGVLSHVDANCYNLFCTLLEACRMIGDSGGASRVQAWAYHLGLIAPAPVARVLLQCSLRQCHSEVSGTGAAVPR